MRKDIVMVTTRTGGTLAFDYSGLVTVMDGGKVVAKLLAGRGGLRSAAVAQSVAKLTSVSIDALVAIAKQHRFGTHGTLVVITAGDMFPAIEHSEVASRHRHYFDSPSVHSSSPYGTSETGVHVAQVVTR